MGFFYRTRVAFFSFLRCACVLNWVCQAPPQPPRLLSGDLACILDSQMFESQGAQFPRLKAFPITLKKTFLNEMIVTIALLIKSSMYENIITLLFPLLFISFYFKEKRRRVNSFSIVWFH